MHHQCNEGLDGILIGYQNVKILMDEKTGLIPMGVAETRVNVSVEFYIFQPKIGGLLQGVVNKKSNQHIGCLVHKYFNATILRPEDVDYDKWEGKDFNVDNCIKFRVNDLDFTSVLPRIEGTIVDSDLPDNNNLKEMDNVMFDGNDSNDSNCENKLLESEKFWETKLNNGNWSLPENDLESVLQLKNTPNAKSVEDNEESENEMQIKEDNNKYFLLQKSKKRKRDSDNDDDDDGGGVDESMKSVKKSWSNKLENVSSQKAMENDKKSEDKLQTEVDTDRIDKGISPGKMKKRKRDQDSDKSAVDIEEKSDELKKHLNVKKGESNREIESEMQIQEELDRNEDVSFHKKNKRKRTGDHNNSATNMENLVRNSLNASGLKSQEKNKEAEEEEIQINVDTNICKDISPQKNKKKKRDLNGHKTSIDFAEKSIENDEKIEVEKNDNVSKAGIEEAEANIFSSTQLEPFSKSFNVEFCSPIQPILSCDKKKTKGCEKPEQKKRSSADSMKNKLEKKILSKLKKKLLLSPEKKITCDNAMGPKSEGNDSEINEEILEINREKRKSKKTEINEAEKSDGSETNGKAYSKKNRSIEKKHSKKSEANEKQDKVNAPEFDKNELEKSILFEMKKKFLLSPEKKMADVHSGILEVDEIDLKDTNEEKDSNDESGLKANQKSNNVDVKKKEDSGNSENETNVKKKKISSELGKSKLEKKILSEMKRNLLISPQKKMANVHSGMLEEVEVDLKEKTNEPEESEMNESKNGEIQFEEDKCTAVEMNDKKESNSVKVKKNKKSNRRESKGKNKSINDEANEKRPKTKSEHGKNKLEKKILSEIKRKLLISPEKKMADFHSGIQEEDDVDSKKKSGEPDLNELKDPANGEVNEMKDSKSGEIKENKRQKHAETKGRQHKNAAELDKSKLQEKILSKMKTKFLTSFGKEIDSTIFDSDEIDSNNSPSDPEINNTNEMKESSAMKMKKHKKSNSSETKKKRKSKKYSKKSETNEINGSEFDKNELEKKILSEMKRKYLQSPKKEMADVRSGMLEEDEVDLMEKTDEPEKSETKESKNGEIQFEEDKSNGREMNEKDESNSMKMKKNKKSNRRESKGKNKSINDEANEKRLETTSEHGKNKLEKKILSEMKRKLLFSPEEKMADVHSEMLEEVEVDLKEKTDEPEESEKKDSNDREMKASQKSNSSEIKETKKSSGREMKKKKKSNSSGVKGRAESSDSEDEISSETDKTKLENKILSEMKKKFLLSPEMKMADVASGMVDSNEVDSRESSPSKIGSHFDSSKNLKNSKEKSKSMEMLKKKKKKKKKKEKMGETEMEGNVSALYSKLLHDAVSSLSLPEVDFGKTSDSDFKLDDEFPAETPNNSKEKTSRKKKKIYSGRDPKRKSMNSPEVETETNFDSDLKSLDESVKEVMNLREKIIENQTKKLKSDSNLKSSDECEKDSIGFETIKKDEEKEIKKKTNSLLENFLKLSGVKEKTKKEKKEEQFAS